MKIQNLADTITADLAAFTEWDTYTRNVNPFIDPEYFTTRAADSDYTTRVSILDEDQLPIVTAVVDVYDDIEEAALQLSFVANLADSYRQDLTNAQLQALLEGYEIFVAEALFPFDMYKNENDLRLVSYLLHFVQQGRNIEDFFAVPPATRKRRFVDHSQHPFRATATKIAELFQAAS